MKNFLRILFAIGCFAAATMMSAWSHAGEIPEYFRACCCVSGCSAVVVSSGPQWSRVMTARHCFGGKHLGDKFPVVFIDGSRSEATLLTTHRGYDLAMLAVPTRDVIGTCKLAVGRPDKAHYEAVGWPAKANGQQLTYYYLTPTSQSERHTSGEAGQFETGSARRWAFEVHNDGNTPGASGMPIFANGQLIGINSNNNGHRIGTLSLFSTPAQTAEFISLADRDRGTARWNLGNWSEPAVNLADATAVAFGREHSNKPLNLQVFQAPQIGNAPPPPPDFNSTEPPPSPAGTPPSRNHGEAIPPPAGIPPLYSGKGRAPEGYRHARERSSKIIATEHHDAEQDQREAALAAEISRLKAEHDAEVARLRDELENTKSIAKQPGPAGRDGRDGQDFTPPKIEPVVKPKPKHGPMHAILLGGLVLVGVVVVDQIHRTRRAAT